MLSLDWVCSSTFVAFQLINNFLRLFVVCFSLKKIRKGVQGKNKTREEIGEGQPLLVHTTYFCVLWRINACGTLRERIVVKHSLFIITRTGFSWKVLLKALHTSVNSILLLFLNGSHFIFQFIYPLPGEQGYEFMYAEFKDHKCYFTSLLHYQVRIMILTSFSENM